MFGLPLLHCVSSEMDPYSARERRVELSVGADADDVLLPPRYGAGECEAHATSNATSCPRVNRLVSGISCVTTGPPARRAPSRSWAYAGPEKVGVRNLECWSRS